MATKPDRRIMGRPPHLTEKEVEELRDWHRTRTALGTLTQIAAKYGVDTSTVMKAVKVGYKQYGR